MRYLASAENTGIAKTLQESTRLILRIFTSIFAGYLGLEHDDLVEIKVQADSEWDAWSKVKMVLGEHVDIQVTGLYLNDWYENAYIDEDEEYYNCWCVTDNYNSDFPICLTLGVDFVER